MMQDLTSNTSKQNSKSIRRANCLNAKELQNWIDLQQIKALLVDGYPAPLVAYCHSQTKPEAALRGIG